MSYKNMTTEEILKDLGKKVEAARLAKGIDERHWTGVSSATYSRFKSGKGIKLEGFVKLLQQLNGEDDLESLLLLGANLAMNQKRITRKEQESNMSQIDQSVYVSPLDDPRVTLEMALAWQEGGYRTEMANDQAKALNAKDSSVFAWTGSALEKRFDEILILTSKHEGMYSVKLQVKAYFKMSLPERRVQLDKHNPNKERILVELVLDRYDFLFEHFGLLEGMSEDELKKKVAVMAEIMTWFGSPVGQGLVRDINEKYNEQLDEM